MGQVNNCYAAMNIRYLVLSFSLIVGVQSTLAHANPPNEFIGGVAVNTSNGAALRISDPNQRNESFNSNLKRRGLKERITKCTSLIDVPVGTAHGNHSYGGLCTTAEGRKKMRVMICDDEMIGHFELKKVQRKVKMQELVDFVVSNCYGG